MNADEPDRDALFVEIAQSLGYLTSEQAKECREDQIKMEDMGYSRSLIQIATEKGYIDQGKALEIRREMQKRGVLPRIGGYEILSKLGQGGMGAVYKARQVSLDRIVALKVLPPELARDKNYVERFKREGKIAAKITHPNAVQVIDVGESGGRHFMVMEYVDGFSADRLLASGPLPESHASSIIRAVLDALVVAHASGIIHRDIKPANILINNEGRTKLADLGIAKQAGARGATLTGTGAALGTPYYMSPEQCRGAKDLDERADIYSLGATFYHLCCGEPPYAEIHPMAVMHYQMNAATPDPRERNPKISEPVAALIMRMMAKDRENRPKNCAAVIQILEAIRRGDASNAVGLTEAAPMAAPSIAAPKDGWASFLPVTTPAAAFATFRKSRALKAGAGALAAVIFALILIMAIGRSGGQDPLAGMSLDEMDQFIARGEVLSQEELAALYEAKWQDLNRLEEENKWAEVLISLGEMKVLGGQLIQKPASYALIDMRVETALNMLSVAASPGRAAGWPFDSAEARRRQTATASALGIPVEKTVDLGNGVELELVLIPAGEFMMGSPADVSEIREGEQPQRRARITRPFYIGKYEVTQAQWEQVMGENPSANIGADSPVENVSWNETQIFIRRLNARRDVVSRLPTEAEWEFACRAGTTTSRYSGDSERALNDIAWYSENSGQTTQPVGQKRANAWGLYDMLGNVWEWCGDWYDEDYHARSPVSDPAGPSYGELRALRGGSIYDIPDYVSVFFRGRDLPDQRRPYKGFRLLCEIPAMPAEPAITQSPSGREMPEPADENTVARIELSRSLVYTGWPFEPAEAGRRQRETSETLGIPMEKMIDVGEDAELAMVLIPAGEFSMGSPANEEGRNDNEGPQRRVRITRPFYIGKYPVTQSLWTTIMGQNPSTYVGDDIPVNGVTFHQAAEFIDALNDKLQMDGVFLLPTEAEWEYACRAGTETRFYSGDSENNLYTVAWYSGNSNARQPDGYYLRQPHVIGQKRPNAWGLYDMLGNVREWCQDWYQDSYSGLATVDPKGPASSRSRLVRGGWYSAGVEQCRSGARYSCSPDNTLGTGMRLVYVIK